MEDTEMEIVLTATDNASSTFEAVQEAASEMGSSIENAGDGGLDDVITDTESLQTAFDQATAEVERLKSELEFSEDYGFDDVDELSAQLAEAEAEAERLGTALEEATSKGSDGMEQMEESAQEAVDPLEQITTIIGGLAGAEIFSQLADTLWDFADKAGTFEDSLMRARLEAEGAGISVNDMTDTVSELGRVTGRAGGEIREAFITATARGITDLDSFKQMMIGAGAQATLLGTDIDSMANKMSGLAMRSSVMERTLANTGITVEELGNALGIQGATIDDINAKWETMDTNQRAAALGMAASMNEGKTANEEYKKSWAGLQAQLDIAKGRLERLAGEVLLPVLIPALEVAGRVLNWLGDTISAVMDGPLGGLVSAIGAVVAGFALVVPAVMAIQGAMALYTASLAPAITATWALLSPWLPFIAIGAAIVALIYEIGKAFGWWSDVGSMIDSIWAGIQRLWSAFINHPDVQGFIQGVSDAWKAMQPFLNTTISLILKFFNVSGKKDFDIVRTLIDTISKAWAAMTLPIKTVIEVIKTLWNAFGTMYEKCKTALDNAKKAFDNFKAKVKQIIDNVKEKVKSITNINISGVINKIVQPFKDAYDGVKKQVDKIKREAKSIPSNVGRGGLGILGGAFGFDYEGMLAEMSSGNNYSVDSSLTLDHNINFKFDFTNLPEGTSEENLIAMLQSAITDRSVINSLVNSPDFQSLDGKVKERLVLKGNRARGV